MITKECPVVRAQYGFLVMQQAPNLPGIQRLNGQPQMQQTHMPVVANHHELRFTPSGMYEDYTMFCIYCGHTASQAAWVGLLSEAQKS